ncbi:cytochrome P450 [Arthrobacter mobilis]|uniref:Cytochrome P450 n=1 Tax=Arthrobacter mobilis TaxID=2724944 RepID=A0A7X6HEX9_9MICC|nr:cytochrome P450 [Arthrobacter mobilis]NKX55917.1 cytochrome P450 [Arthrobacter mobilis]
MTATKDLSRPAHVPTELVIDFDWFNFGTKFDDLQLEWERLREKAPGGIFWTPRNGGHWVPLGGEDVATVLSDYTRFSAIDIYIPANVNRTAQLIPIEMDPPEQLDFRKIIIPFLASKNLQPVEDRARALTISLIEGFLARGECEFVSEFAAILPVAVFLDLMGLPQDDREMLRGFGEQITRSSDPEQRLNSQKALEGYLLGWMEQRRQDPGDDLLSAIVTADVNGREITETEALMLAMNVLLGGLDTVVNMLGFFALFLARNPGHRKQLIENPELVKPAVEELMRRHSIVANGRRVIQDTEMSGAQLRAGDMILGSTVLYGTDASITSDPFTVDFERESSKHIAFGKGNHVCPGQHLARRELKVFLEEWMKRIPDFSLQSTDQLQIAVGHVAGLTSLELRWPS